MEKAIASEHTISSTWTKEAHVWVQESRRAQLLVELKASDKQHEALHSSLVVSTAQCRRQRQVCSDAACGRWHMASSAPSACVCFCPEVAMLCRVQIQELSQQLSHLREASRRQQAKVQAAGQAAAQQKDDAAWVQQMTSEIQALSARITSLLRELVVSPTALTNSAQV